ncbi:MAG: CDP-alcohol phosphatidyltransferase family protein [Deltaproteobacteria bacterium]|nr:CDP-alcohol phosphatidyltransferase family protein [Deltaproteobacteria bacterium]
MIRGYSLADLLTLTNASAGVTSVFLLLSHVDAPAPWKVWAAVATLCAALVADGLDGWVARRRGTHSAMGRELDSLADVISFGMAPAVLGWVLGLRGLLDAPVLILFVGAAVSRLARYNVTAAGLSGPTGKVRHFEGTPVTFNILAVGTLALLFGAGLTGTALPLGALGGGAWVFHPLVLVYAVLAATMVSRTLHVPKP